MVTYFTELNRKRPTGAVVDYITHSTSPIVHAADDDFGDGDAAVVARHGSKHLPRFGQGCVIASVPHRLRCAAIPMARTASPTGIEADCRCRIVIPAKAACSPRPGALDTRPPLPVSDLTDCRCTIWPDHWA